MWVSVPRSLVRAADHKGGGGFVFRTSGASEIFFIRHVRIAFDPAP